MELYSRQRARGALFHTVGFRAVSQLGTVLSYVVLVRGLSEQLLGVFSLLYSVIPVVGTVASLGLDQVLRRFQPEYLLTGNTAGAAWLVRIVTLARLASSISLLGLLILAWNLVAPVFHLTTHRADFVLFGVIVLLYFQINILQNSLASHMLHRYSVGSVAVQSIGKLISYTVVLRCFPFTLRNAIWADIAANGVTYAFLFIAHWRLCSPPTSGDRYQPSPAERARLMRYAIANNFNDAGSLLLYSQTNNFFIAALMKPIAVGTYAFYSRLSDMMANLIPIRLFENVVQPMMFAVKPEQAEERLPRYFTMLININMLLQWPFIAYAVAYHREIVEVLFGGKFLDDSTLLPVIVSLAIGSNVFAIPVTMVAQYREKASLIMRSQLFGIYQIVAMLSLIPILGLYGAAIATGTLHLFRNLYVWWHVRANARWTNWQAVLSIGLIVWGAAIAACMALRHAVTLSPTINMLCGLVIFVIAALVYIRSAAIAKSDREILANVLHGHEGRVLRWIGMLPREPKTS
jgi:O-antigen/teichoic acid export membrane protein